MDFILVILEKTIRIPRSLSVKAASVLKGFLNKNPIDRLGCNLDSGFYDIISHPFFKTIDWEMVNYLFIYLFNFLTPQQAMVQVQLNKIQYAFMGIEIRLITIFKRNLFKNY